MLVLRHSCTQEGELRWSGCLSHATAKYGTVSPRGQAETSHLEAGGSPPYAASEESPGAEEGPAIYRAATKLQIEEFSCSCCLPGLNPRIRAGDGLGITEELVECHSPIVRGT